jgi:hypothetical protein
LSLSLEIVEDAKTQENFRRIQETLNQSPFQGMSLLSLTFGKAETALTVPHGLSFAPKDVIITNKQGAGSFSVDQSLTDRTNLVVSTTGACTVRVLVGTLGGT